MQLKQFQEIRNKIAKATDEVITNKKTDKIVKLKAIEEKYIFSEKCDK